MCSSPKGSRQCFRHTKKTEFSRSDYTEYASMVERASAVYDRLEREKAERQALIVKQDAILVDELKPIDKNKEVTQTGFFTSIKTFLLQPVFSSDNSHIVNNQQKQRSS